MRTASVLLAASLTLFACGGATTPAPEPSEDAGAPAALDAGAEVGTDARADARDGGDGGDCWRCADRAWRNVCVVPAKQGTDAESCLHCGEHCVSDPPDATGE